MKRKLSRVLRSGLSLVLVLSMMFGLCGTALASESSVVPGIESAAELNYVSLGDSMTNGYGLEGYDGNNGVEDYGEGSYAIQFAKHYGFNHAQLAMSAMRAEDLHWLLEVDYADSAVADVINDLATNGWSKDKWYSVFTNGDYWTWDQLVNNYRFDVAAYCIEGKDKTDNGKFNTRPDGYKVANNEYTDIGALKVVAEYYQTAVENANVVSLGMGNGNFGVFMFGRILEAIEFDGEPADAMIYDVENAIRECDPAMQDEIRVLIDELYATIEGYTGIAVDRNDTEVDTVEALLNTVVYTAVSYVLNYAGSVEAILQLNPDAEIILVALMNTFEDKSAEVVALTEEDGAITDVTLGDMMGLVFTPLNAFIAGLPTYMQATGNGVYDEATFYYAEPDDKIECLVEVYGEDFYNTDGTLNAGSIIRDRFVQSIVGYCDHTTKCSDVTTCEAWESGMVWGLLGDTELVDGISLCRITLADVLAYDAMPTDAEKATYAAANNQKAVSIAVYLAFEDAVISPTVRNASVGLTSVLGLGGLGIELFAPVMADFMTNVGTAGAAYVDTATQVVKTGMSANQSIIDALSTADMTLEQFISKGQEGELTGNVYETYYTEYINNINLLCMLLALPETLSESLQTVDPAVTGLLSLFARCVIGNGLGGHPSQTGHNTLATELIETYDTGYTAKDETIANLETALQIAYELTLEYYDEAYAYAYDYAEENGYIGEATAAIDSVIAALNGIDLSGTEMTEAFKAEALADIEEIVETLEAAKALITEADELDQAALNALIATLDEAGEAVQQLVATLKQAGVDVNELAVIPALEAAYTKLVDEVIPAVTAKLEEAVKAGAEYLAEKLGEALDTLTEALADAFVKYYPEAADWAYNYLYNNPDKVIAFVQTYGPYAADFIAEYQDELIMILGWIAVNYGDEVVDFILANDEEILKTMVEWYNVHGENTWALIMVYLEELGVIDAIEGAVENIYDKLGEVIVAANSKIEEIAAAVKAEIEAQIAKLEEAKAALEAELARLQAELENATGEAKAEIEKAIAEVEKAIEAIEEAIAALEEKIEELMAIASDIADAVENVFEAIAMIEEDFSAAVKALQEALRELADAVGAAETFVAELNDTIAEVIGTVAEVIDAIADISEQAGEIAAEIVAGTIEALETVETLIGEVQTAIEEAAAALEDAVAALQEAVFNAYYAVLVKCTYGEEMTYVALGGATVANGGYVDAVAEYVEAKDPVNLGKAMAYADQVAYVTENAESIAAADFITYQMDANEVVGALVDVFIAANVGDAYTAPTWSKYVDVEEVANTAAEVKGEVLAIKAELADYLDADTVAQIAEMEADILAKLDEEIDEEAVEQAKPYVEHLVYNLFAYAVETAKGIEAVKAVNATAPVVLVGMYNTLDGVTVKMDGQEIDLGEYFAYVIDVVDVYDLIYAIVSGNVTFVDASEAAVDPADINVDTFLGLYAEVEKLNASLNGLTDMDAVLAIVDQIKALVTQIETATAGIEGVIANSANEAGHAYIAEQIAKALIIVDHEPAEAVYENVAAATCGADGSYDEVVYCSVCGTELSREAKTIPATGEHTWDAGVVTKEPTATETGVKTYTCTVCGETKTEEIPALGEDKPDDPKPEDPECKHDYKVTASKDAACTEDGSKTYTCSLCGDSYTETVKATGHSDDCFCANCGEFLCDGEHNCPSKPYSDLDTTAWYHEATDYVIYNGLMNGTSTTEKVWSPNMTITRGMVVTTLYRMAGEPEYTAENVYADLDDSWYTDAMLWATEVGILQGYGNGNCGPKDPVTREQMALFFQRYVEFKGIETDLTADLSEFPDAGKISSWAVEGMEWAVATGMYEGRAADEGAQPELAPQGTGLRTELATLLYRMNTTVLK